ncbi:hypothetical protein [Arthrobacter citreus]|uniref:hypothetical protein n=1 Tax=Arthrobacter citreus TaxID=1670 RepID=UPI0036DC9238
MTYFPRHHDEQGDARLVSLNVTSKRARARGEMAVQVPVSHLPPAVERAVCKPHAATATFDYGQGTADITEVLTAVAAEV